MSISEGQQPADMEQAASQPGRVELAFDNARRHSGRVRVLKFLLPAAAILLVAAFAGRSWLAAPANVSVNLAASGIEDGRLVMADPRLEGFTSDNRAYTMTAARAIQDIGGGGRIDLEQIDARLPFDDGNWMSVVASTGVFDSDANTLDLDTDVKFVTDNGITALLRSAAVDIAAGSMTTEEPVDITMEGTRIEADSMTVSEKGAVMTFDRRVRVEIEASRLRNEAQAQGDTNGD